MAIAKRSRARALNGVFARMGEESALSALRRRCGEVPEGEYVDPMVCRTRSKRDSCDELVGMRRFKAEKGRAKGCAAWKNL